MSRTQKALSICLLFAAASMSAFADDKPESVNPSNLVYDDLPANWDYYALSEDNIEKYKGEDKRELCFDEDFITQSKPYERYKYYNRKLRTTYNYILLKGVEDFRVIDQNHLVIKTPETGLTLIETRYCKKSLRRAKYLPLTNIITRSGPNRCYIRKNNVTIMTRDKSGYDSCKIENMYEWTGPFDPLTLKEGTAGD